MSDEMMQPQGEPTTQPAGEEAAAPAAPVTPEEGMTPEVAQPAEGEQTEGEEATPAQ